MKKFTVLLAAFAAFAAVSCNKEIPVETPAPEVQDGFKTVTITANIEGQTKTSYDADGKFSWTKGDQISVLCSDDNLYTFTASETGNSSAFTGVIPTDVTLGSQAFFPADENHALNTFSLAATTDAIDASLPLIGKKIDGDAFEFAHYTGGFQFTIENIPADIKIIEASFVTTDLKISGIFSVWGDDAGKLISGVYAAANDAEKKYARKVSVTDGTAKVYLPYGVGGDLWGTTTMTIVGYDNDDNATELTTKELKLGGLKHSRAVIIPVKSLVLEDRSNLKNIDWTNSNVATYVLEDWMYESYPQYSDIKELKAVADEKFVYACVTPTKEVKEIRFFFADHGETKSGDLWMWENTGYTTYHKSSRATVTDNKFNLVYEGKDVELITEVIDGKVTWYMAFPRKAGTWTLSSGSVYLGFMTYGEGFEAPIPKVFGEMLEVTLP